MTHVTWIVRIVILVSVILPPSKQPLIFLRQFIQEIPFLYARGERSGINKKISGIVASIPSYRADSEAVHGK